MKHSASEILSHMRRECSLRFEEELREKGWGDYYARAAAVCITFEAEEATRRFFSLPSLLKQSKQNKATLNKQTL